MIPPCKILEWDSSFFDRRIARLIPPRLTPAILTAVDDWVLQHQIECVYFLCDAADGESIALAEQHGFHLTDIRLTLETSLGAGGTTGTETLPVHPVIPEQIPALKAIARASHTATRFYQDSHFQRSQCEALYETWIEKSCAGDADMVFTIQLEGEVAGYITCHLDSGAGGHIGLLAVAEVARGQGGGQALVQAALRWFQSRHITHVTVVTQGGSPQAQRLYQRCGFISRSVELWFHYWPTP